ncbi:hypothetical protein L1286_04205 [Pseudoalteromonas sp. SMS1]|uniref:hypothetical protein n=1 Tax=Pseudoalteromonas sp. SMS1 TaxID=2908894 RepID=UPI001F31E907|nr:hypothetical protein [Pseudoalteromonas sp. SMS1]MCF2856658.1 hypothetical protein [Pseudoalteromonas sp. SMS1]
MNILKSALGVSVLALGLSANLATAAQVTITEQNYGGGVIIERADVILDHSQGGTFTLTVSENHLSINATDSNGRRFRCSMNGIVSYDPQNLLEKVTNIASTISENDRVQIEVQKGALPQKCHIKKLLSF